MELHFIIDKKYDLRFAQNVNAKQKMEKQYRKGKSVLLYSVCEYQKAWDEINHLFSRYIEQTIGYAWAHEKYYCVVSPVHQGISNWDGSDRIIRWWKENPYAICRITAHELILHHYFYIVRKFYSDVNLTDKQIWALAEIAAFALTSLTPQVKKFWPWDTDGYYTNHNYQSIVQLQNKLKNPFLKRNSFDEYIQTGIRLVKKYKHSIKFN
jgi:hypothetical protein